MNKPTKKQIAVLRKALKNIERYPESFGTRYWITQHNLQDTQSDMREGISEKTMEYPEEYRLTNASLAGHIAITLGCPVTAEYTRKTLPKALQKHLDKDHYFIHLPELVSRFLGGTCRGEHDQLFFEDEWPEPFRSEFHIAMELATTTDVDVSIKILKNRIEHFIQTGE